MTRACTLFGASILASAAGAQVDSCAVYDNAYTGASTHADPAQIFEQAFGSYDIWLGDDFETDVTFTDLVLSSTGFCTDACADPFEVTDFVASIWDGLPNDPATSLVMASTGFAFDGVDTWSASFGEQTLAPGDYVFTFAADLDFADGRTFFFQEAQGEASDGFMWNPGGAFGFPDDLFHLQDGEGAPSAPNACIDATLLCAADCDGSGSLDVLDFVCFQQAWQVQAPAGDCDGNGVYDVLDFICFQLLFQQGCG